MFLDLLLLSYHGNRHEYFSYCGRLLKYNSLDEDDARYKKHVDN